MTVVTEANLVLAGSRNAGDSTGEAASVSRAIMRGSATHDDRVAHNLRAVLAANLVEGSPLILSEPVTTLTAGRGETLRLIADGLSTTEIAAVMHLSLSTVAKHIANMRDDLGVATRVEAVVEATRQGILPAPPAPAGRPSMGRARRVACSGDGCSKRTAHPSGACPDHR